MKAAVYHWLLPQARSKSNKKILIIRFNDSVDNSKMQSVEWIQDNEQLIGKGVTGVTVA